MDYTSVNYPVEQPLGLHDKDVFDLAKRIKDLIEQKSLLGYLSQQLIHIFPKVFMTQGWRLLLKKEMTL